MTFGKIFSKFSVIFFLLCYRLENFKAPFCKNFQKIPEVSKISKNKVLQKIPVIWYHLVAFAFWLIHLVII